MNTENMLMLYLAECEERRRLDRKTVKAYRCDLRQFCHFLNGRAASRTLLEDYLCRLHARYAPRSVRRKLASLHAFFSYLVFHERIEENPLDKIRTFKNRCRFPERSLRHDCSTFSVISTDRQTWQIPRFAR